MDAGGADPTRVTAARRPPGATPACRVRDVSSVELGNEPRRYRRAPAPDRERALDPRGFPRYVRAIRTNADDKNDETRRGPGRKNAKPLNAPGRRNTGDDSMPMRVRS